MLLLANETDNKMFRLRNKWRKTISYDYYPPKTMLFFYFRKKKDLKLYKVICREALENRKKGPKVDKTFIQMVLGCMVKIIKLYA